MFPKGWRGDSRSIWGLKSTRFHDELDGGGGKGKQRREGREIQQQ